MFTGRLAAIYTAPVAGAPMMASTAVEATARVGLRGDRYAAQTGTFSARPGSGREVTLIEREAIVAVNTEGDVHLDEHETRRNLVTEGVPLNHLVGCTFRVGSVVLVGTRLAEPCSHLAGLTRPGVSRALIHRGGLRAEIAVGGVLRVGDDIAVTMTVPVRDIARG